MNAEIPTGRRMPDWQALGDALSRDLPSRYASDGPIESLSAYEHAFGRTRLVEAVMQALFAGKARPGIVHERFCAIPFEVVVTTNVEQILELQYLRRHGGLLTVTEEGQLRLPNPYAGPTLIKLHGDLHQPATLVLTERDYDDFSTRRPLFVTWLANQLISKTGVLIGYSLDDPDFRQVLSLIRSRLGENSPDLYVIEVNANPTRVERYQRRGVRVINLPKTSGGYGILADLFQELHEYWTGHFSATLTGTTAAVRALLRAGQRVDKAVLFIVDDSSLSLYDEYVFGPLLERGWIPLTPQDVVHPGGYRVATLDALLRVAGQVIIHNDGLNPGPVQQAISRVGSDRVILVTSDSIEGLSDDLRVLAFPTIPEEWDEFYHAVEHELSLAESQNAYILDGAVIDNTGSSASTPDMRAMLILSFVDLESGVRKLLSQREWLRTDERPKSLSQLLIIAGQHLRWPISETRIRSLIFARNSLIHGNGDLTEIQMKDIYGDVQTLEQLVADALRG